MTTAIRVEGLSKRYSVFATQGARFMHAVTPAWRRGVDEVWALRDVGFEIERGEAFAVIGRNGGGKSTLLQILAGTVMPTGGSVKVDGRISALLELGSGFNPEYTGRDNVMMNGLILGLGRSEIARRFDRIAAFAEIGDAIDRPVKTYSSGMLMRLAFAVQVLTDPEILVIDEALSVGDFFFQQKCLGYIRSLVAKGVTLVFVSHDMSTVRDLCTRALYLRDGRVAYVGDTPNAIRHYLAEGAGNGAAEAAGSGAATAPASEVEAIVRDAAWRAPQAAAPGRLVAVSLHDESGVPSSSFRLGGQLVVKVAYRPAERDATHVTAIVRNKFDQLVTCVGSLQLDLTPPAAHGGLNIFEMTMALPLEAGTYSVTINLFRAIAPNQGENLDSSGPIGPIAIHWDYERDRAPFLGMFGPAAHGSFRSASA